MIILTDRASQLQRTPNLVDKNEVRGNIFVSFVNAAVEIILYKNWFLIMLA